MTVGLKFVAVYVIVSPRCWSMCRGAITLKYKSTTLVAVNSTSTRSQVMTPSSRRQGSAAVALGLVYQEAVPWTQFEGMVATTPEIS